MKSLTSKITTITLILAASFLSAPLAFAQTETSNQFDQKILGVTGDHEILKDVKEEVMKCALELVARGPASSDTSIEINSNVVAFESTCPSLKILSQNKAQIFIENVWYTATISDSEDSDGGDLDNMVLTNPAGKVVATRTNVAAYNQVILAMTGGYSKLHQKLVPTVLTEF